MYYVCYVWPFEEADVHYFDSGDILFCRYTILCFLSEKKMVERHNKILRYIMTITRITSIN